MPPLQEAKKAEEAAAKHQADLEAAEKIHADIAAKEAAAKGQADGVDCQGYWSACSATCGASIDACSPFAPVAKGSDWASRSYASVDARCRKCRAACLEADGRTNRASHPVAPVLDSHPQQQS